MQELILNGYGSESDASNDESYEEPPTKRHQKARMADGKDKERPIITLPNAAALLNADPASIGLLIATTSGRGDDDNDDGRVPEWKRPRQDGRVLSFPPSSGSHAILVFIPVSLPGATKEELSTLISDLRSRGFKLNPLTIDLEPKEPSREGPSSSLEDSSQSLHISLSRTQPIKFHLVDSLLKELKSSLAKAGGSVMSVSGCNQSPRVNLSSTTSFVNEEKTCSFASMSVGDVEGSIDFIYSIIVAVNHVFTMHGLQTYYRSPRLHVSFAWAAGDHKEELGAALRERDACFTPASIPIESIVCRIGKIDHPLLNLKSSVAVSVG